MDQRERINDNEEALRAALQGWQASMWTALPGIIESFDAEKLTCSVAPAIQARVRAADGSFQWVSLPLLVDCPVIFPNGGDFVITFPVRAGDECLVIFSSRCIDAWWQSAGIQVQAELRMHDLSDGFVLVGPRSQPSILAGQPAVSTNSTQLRTKDGSAYIELAPGGVVNIKAPGGVHVTGAIVATDEITAKNTHTVSAHIHGGVQNGGGNTNPPLG